MTTERKVYDPRFIPNAQQNTPDDWELAIMIDFDEAMRSEAGDVDVQVAKLIEQCEKEKGDGQSDAKKRSE